MKHPLIINDEYRKMYSTFIGSICLHKKGQSDLSLIFLKKSLVF